MSDVLFAWGGVHPRTLIRRAVCQVMREHDGLAALIGARIWPNRMEHWFRGELPAAGVYTVSEQRVESDTRPEPQERVISLAVELLGGELEAVDDTLDALCLQTERAVLRLDAIGRAMGAIVDASLPEPLPLVHGTHPADTLLSITHTGTELGIVTDGAREYGAAALNFDLEYQWPTVPPELADFLLAHTDWYVHPGDDRVDMISQVNFDQE
ncbi:hypothetical protein [Desulfovibrio piger]|uniref:hypothetical protein n=1 Tax=Desulfovibrio piger TaxID=901 RepID=UPI0026EF8998|nr:hypothetical protein [Desulfovibrio piger]